MSLLTYLRSAGVHLFSWSATKKLHEDMVHSIFNAPVNLYFDRTPIARLMNIFSKDLNQLEIQMSYHASFFMIMFYNLISIGCIAAMAHIYMLVLIPMVIIICLDIVNTTLPAINEASQLTRMTKSPILSHIQDSMSGTSTIRVYGRTEEFIAQAQRLLNIDMLAIKIQQGVMQWLSLRINLLSIMLMAVIASACVLLRADVPPEEKHISDLGIGESKEALEPIVLSMLLGYVLTI